MDKFDGFFHGWPYTEIFHVWTGWTFIVLASIAVLVASFVLGRIYSAMNTVSAVSDWKACVCKASVQRHLCRMLYIILLKTLLMAFVVWLDFGTGWKAMGHANHLLHYGIFFVFVGLIGWAISSTRHFSGLAACSGSIAYHVNKGTDLSILNGVEGPK